MALFIGIFSSLLSKEVDGSKGIVGWGGITFAL
jgi:hypothetical protein